MDVRDIQKKAYATAVSKGWYTDETFCELLLMVHSELSEALEEVPARWAVATAHEIRRRKTSGYSGGAG